MTLASLIDEPKERKPIITIMSDAGMGKTTLGATFPKPLFIRAEDGTKSVQDKLLSGECSQLKLLRGSADLWNQLQLIFKEEHEYQTLVIDSVSALDVMFREEMIAEDFEERKKRDKEAKPLPFPAVLGGYGKSFEALASRHEKVRRHCAAINARRDMTIVFLGHAMVEKIDLPDQDPYTRYSLRVGKGSAPAYIDGVDLVGFLRLQSFVETPTSAFAGKNAPAKPGKAKSFGNRQLICHAVAANVSKNRLGIDQPLTVAQGENPLLPFLNLAPSAE